MEIKRSQVDKLEQVAAQVKTTVVRVVLVVILVPLKEYAVVVVEEVG